VTSAILYGILGLCIAGAMLLFVPVFVENWRPIMALTAMGVAFGIMMGASL